jgi:hypothetical protein
MARAAPLLRKSLRVATARCEECLPRRTEDDIARTRNRPREHRRDRAGIYQWTGFQRIEVSGPLLGLDVCKRIPGAQKKEVCGQTASAPAVELRYAFVA